MVQFDSVNEIQTIIDELTNKAEPLVIIIPKGSGRREDRYTHLLCGEPDIEAISQSISKEVSSTRNEESHSKIQELEARIAKLEEQMSILIG